MRLSLASCHIFTFFNTVVGECVLVLRPENQGEYLSYQPSGKGVEWKSFWFYVGNFESPLPERIPGAPKAQANWMDAEPGGGQVITLLEALARLKKNGVTGDHVVYTFLSHRVQPLQYRTHPAFRYEGTKDPSRFSPELMPLSDLIRRCCKVLDNFDKKLILPSLLWPGNPPEKV